MKQEVRESPRLAQAKQRLQDIQTKRSELVSHQASLNARIELAQKEVGREYLTGSRDGLRRVVELRVEIEALQSALELLAADQSAAEIDIERAKAIEIRERAQTKREELESLDAKTGVLLAKLAELEGVRFTHSILSSEPVIDAYMQVGWGDHPLEYQSVAELVLRVPGGPMIVQAPRSRQLRGQIEELEREASLIEEKAKLAAEKAIKAG
jgi:hypothetical protein